MSASVYLAHEIEWTHAIDRARLKGRLRGRLTKEARKQAIATEFDPHAATELAELIERRMRPATRRAP